MELHNEQIMQNLLFRNLPIYPLHRDELVNHSILDKKFFTSLILSCDDENIFKKTLLPYIHDAQLAVFISFQKTENWEYSFDAHSDSPDYVYEGELLSALFKRLDLFIDNSELINYYISELFLKCIRFPHPAIYSYFLCTSQVFPSSFRILKDSLLKVMDVNSNFFLFYLISFISQ